MRSQKKESQNIAVKVKKTIQISALVLHNGSVSVNRYQHQKSLLCFNYKTVIQNKIKTAYNFLVLINIYMIIKLLTSVTEVILNN